MQSTHWINFLYFILHIYLSLNFFLKDDLIIQITNLVIYHMTSQKWHQHCMEMGVCWHKLSLIIHLILTDGFGVTFNSPWELAKSSNSKL